MKTVTTLLLVLLSTALIAGTYLSDEGMYGSGTSGFSKAGTITSTFLEFDGISSHVQLSKSLTIGNTSNTIEAWIKVPVMGTKNLSVNARVGIILGNYDDTPSANWEIHSAGQMRLYWKTGEIDARGTTDLRDNEWHHVAFVRDTDNSKIVMYVDGEEEVLDNSGIEGSGSDIDAFGSIHRIGADNRSAEIPYFHGKIAEIRIWNTARTQQEIQGNMNALDGNESGLVAHYSFDNIIETTLPDNIGDNNGTLQNFTLDVTTQAVTDFTANSAVGNASIKGLGFPFPTAHGFCWSSNTDTPTITSDHSNNLGGASSIGTFSASITELSSNTTYYVRAYASNDEGTSYGEVVVFETPLIYRSGATGNWTSLSTWEVNEGGSWVAATSFPGQTSTDAVVTIQAHLVYISPGADIQINALDVVAGGKLTVHPGGKINIADKMELAGSTVAAIVVNSELPTGTIATLDCAGATLNGTLTEGEAAVGVSVDVPYTGGNGGNHFGQTVGSTGVTGLTAVLESGTFESGNGQLTYIITGTPANSGTATFALTIGGQTCNADFTVNSLAVSGTFTDDRDNQTYKWVKIGNQVWMAENLNYASANSWCYENSSTNCNHYGRLYNWADVMDGSATSSTNPSGVQGVCPTEWHVPSDAEWTELVNYVVSQGYPDSNNSDGAGNALKSCRQVDSPLGGNCDTSEHPRWDSHNTHSGFDEFGFSALPGGYRLSNGSFGNIGIYGYWLSSTEYSSSYAYGRFMVHSYGTVYRYFGIKTNGFSLRCVRDLD